MSKLVYFSQAGYTQEFIEKLGLPATRIPVKIKEAETFEVDEEFVLIVPTYERKIVHGGRAGQMTYIPRQVSAFFSNKTNRDLARGIIGTGNINFFEDYTRAATEISTRLGIPVLHRMEISGTEQDVEIVKTGLEEFWQNHHQILMRP